ncbi:MAG: pyridoxamine 5'-phosphate oxidase family protein [Chloroflexi bacterium]|nr:pyridoxamine 5'-phosphate oxidase family protein [Chloroflexota bacterium]
MSKFTGVLAWHPEVSMSEEETNDFLSGRWVARMATIGRDGYPAVTPLWYLWDGKCLYFNIAKSRQSLKNLARNPKASVVIDMDERPLMGMRTNFAKAVLVVGDAELTEAGSGQKVRIEAGPYAGEYLPEQAIGFITNRYGLTERDGAIGLTREGFRGLYAQEGIEESQLYKDNIGRVFVKIVPRRMRTWDFSKAPIGHSAES